MKDTLFLQGTFFCSSSFVLSNYIKNWRFYELDVNEARCPCYEDSQGFLLGDGDNLASILDRLKTLKTKMARSVRKQILNLMPILIPGFEDWKTEQLYDGSLGFSIKEKGITKPLLPKMVSDGTIRLLSILLALFYQPYQAQLICLDEPERYLHPQVLKPLVGIMRDISKRTQIIVTTHSAELVKWLEPREVLMVDKIGGITHIVRAQDISMINKFLEEFSLDELWLRGYLKGGKIT
jgi:predicted ATPase